MIPETLDALKVPISSLTPYSANPRQGDVQVISESLQRHGQYRPIVVNARTSEVLAGNHTLAAAIELGWGEIAATFVDVDADTAARIVLVDNRANDRAGYDDNALLTALQELAATDAGLDGTGFELGDLDSLARMLQAPDLDDLAGAVGDPSDEDNWPVIRLAVPHDLYDRWLKLVAYHEGDELQAMDSALRLPGDDA